MAERMNPIPLEDFSIMICVTHPKPCDLSVLRELVGDLIQMSTQKTSGLRVGKDLSFDNLERVKMGILCEAVSLVNSGQLGEMEDALRAKQERENPTPLTLEELREMGLNSRPIWDSCLNEWCAVRWITAAGYKEVSYIGGGNRPLESGRFYRSAPKEET